MSAIEWTDETWNPVTGCTKVSEGCRLCYADRIFPRVYGKNRRFSDVQAHPERFDKPLRWRKPRRVFVNSMSDLFHESIPLEVVDEIVSVMLASPRHSFQVLTKRPARMLEWARRVDPTDPHGEVGQRLFDLRAAIDGDRPWPAPNVWFGVSCEDQKTADERIPSLLQLPAAVRFVSLEPLLGPIDLCRTWLESYGPGELTDPPLGWVIVGGESGPRARPAKPDWVEALRDRCVAFCVPFFFKQWGEWSPPRGDELQQKVDASLRPVHVWPDGSWSVRLGKKIAGRQLDGREWNEFPAIERTNT